MRVFDTQRRVIWEGSPDGSLRDLKIRPGMSVSAEINHYRISSLKFVGRRSSGDGMINLLVMDSKKRVVLSQAFRLKKNTASEFFLKCNLKSDKFFISFSKQKHSLGTVYIDRVIASAEAGGIKGKIGSSALLSKKNSGYNLDNKSLAVIVPYSLFGGAEVYVRDLIKEGYSNVDINVLFLANNKMIKDLKDAPVNIHRVSGIKGLDAHLKKYQYETILYYNSKMVYNFLSKTKQLNKLSSDLVEIYHSDFEWSDSVSSIRERKGVNRLIRVSEGLAKDIVGVDGSSKFYVPVSIDTKRFSPSGGLPKDFIRHGKRVIGTVARLSSEKNIDHVLSIAKILTDFQFLVIGDGPNRLSLQRRVDLEQIKNVELLGHRENVEEFYRAFDGFLLTSTMEGTPISIVESLSCGLPVFTTNVGQIERAFGHLEGVLFLSGKYQDDADKIKGFDYENHNGKKMIEYVSDNHSLNKNRERFFCSVLDLDVDNYSEKNRVVLSGEYV